MCSPTDTNQLAFHWTKSVTKLNKNILKFTDYFSQWVRARGGRTCMRMLTVITYFFLEFHMSLNSYNTKPANIGVHGAW